MRAILDPASRKEGVSDLKIRRNKTDFKISVHHLKGDAT